MIAVEVHPVSTDFNWFPKRDIVPRLRRFLAPCASLIRVPVLSKYLTYQSSRPSLHRSFFLLPGMKRAAVILQDREGKKKIGALNWNTVNTQRNNTNPLESTNGR